MSYTALQLNEAFQDELRRTYRWAATGILALCDRCGAPQRELVHLGLPPEILLGLCPPCMHHVRQEMGRPDSGYLGTAYWNVRVRLAAGPEAGQGPEGPA